MPIGGVFLNPLRRGIASDWSMQAKGQSYGATAANERSPLILDASSCNDLSTGF